jgi:trk system potassium uptake protein TrkA
MKIIIIGCGRVGAGLAKSLSLKGVDVAVIDKDPRAFEALGKTFKGSTHVGIGFDEYVLKEAGIMQAEGLAAVTASDEANLVAARLAKTVFKLPRVAARVYEPQKAKIYRRLGIQTVSPVTLGIERLASTLSNAMLNVERRIGAGQVALVDADVLPVMEGKTAGSISIPGEIQVTAITRNGRTFLTDSETVLKPGDLVHLLVTSGSGDRVAHLFGKHEGGLR